MPPAHHDRRPKYLGNYQHTPTMPAVYLASIRADALKTLTHLFNHGEVEMGLDSIVTRQQSHGDDIRRSSLDCVSYNIITQPRFLLSCRGGW